MSIKPGYSLLSTPEDLVKFTNYIRLYNLTCKIFTDFDISTPLCYLGNVKTPELYQTLTNILADLDTYNIYVDNIYDNIYDPIWEPPSFVIRVPAHNIKPSVINLYKMLLDTNSLDGTQDFLTLFNKALSNNNQ